jgi:hypothetical protein
VIDTTGGPTDLLVSHHYLTGYDWVRNENIGWDVVSYLHEKPITNARQHASVLSYEGDPHICLLTSPCERGKNSTLISFRRAQQSWPDMRPSDQVCYGGPYHARPSERRIHNWQLRILVERSLDFITSRTFDITLM